jgi:hypothetical protein
MEKNFGEAKLEVLAVVLLEMSSLLFPMVRPVDQQIALFVPKDPVRTALRSSSPTSVKFDMP